jgi:hypothetical protein
VLRGLFDHLRAVPVEQRTLQRDESLNAHADKLKEGLLDRRGIRDLHDVDPESDFHGGALRCSHQTRITVHGLNENADPLESRSQLPEEFQPLGYEVRGDARDTRDVAARARQALDVSDADRVAHESEDDGNRGRRALENARQHGQPGSDNIRLEIYQFPGECGRNINPGPLIQLGKPLHDEKVLSLAPPALFQLIHERQLQRDSRRSAVENTQPPHLFRFDGERRGDEGKCICDEGPTVHHSIT